MRIIDISMLIHRDMPVYKEIEEKRPRHYVESSIPPLKVNESAIDMNLHTGTHLDSPFHMIENGSPTEFLPLERLICRARVIDLTQVEDAIREEDLAPHDVKAGEFLLLKTRNSFTNGGGKTFVYMEASGARYLAARGIHGVGIDTPGIEREQPDHETHISLLSRGIIILEGLELAHVAPGEYTLIALPVKIRDADGAPTRAVLVEGLELPV